METEVNILLASANDAPAVAKLNLLFNEVDEPADAIAARMSDPIQQLLEQSRRYLSQFENAKFWLIILGTDKIYSKAYLQNNQIYVSTEAEIIQLENLLKIS